MIDLNNAGYGGVISLGGETINRVKGQSGKKPAEASNAFAGFSSVITFSSYSDKKSGSLKINVTFSGFTGCY